MKKILRIPLLFILVIVACKKDKPVTTSGTVLLTKVTRNGHKSFEYIYSASDNKLVRENDYYIIGSLNPLNNYRLLEYGADNLLAQQKFYLPSDTLNSWNEYQYDNTKRMVWVNKFFKNKLLEYYLYDYDVNNRLVKFTIKDALNQTTGYNEYVYDTQGRLVSQKQYTFFNSQFQLVVETTFTHEGTNEKYNWARYWTVPTDFSLPEFTMLSRRIRTYDPNGTVTGDYTETASGKQFDGDGLLIKQTLTKKYTKPANPDETTIVEYGFVKTQ